MLAGPRPPLEAKLVVVMVGLPARGKTYVAHRFARYLRWQGYRTKVFNVGNYRRAEVGAKVPHGFFDPGNPEGLAARRAVAMHALDDLLCWLEGDGEIAIYDATNSTRDRRRLVALRCERAGRRLLFVETICDDPEIIESNIRQTKLSAPDYAGVEAEPAARDFRARIAHYERAYEPIEGDQLSFLKLIDAGRMVVANRVEGYLAGRLAHFAMSMQIAGQFIFLTRHGQSGFNVQGLIGGDSGLSEIGQRYALRLQDFIGSRVEAEEPLTVWTSTLRRTIQTATVLGRPSWARKDLDEIDAGRYDGLSYPQIKARHPEQYAARQQDKLRYRYPRGESYQDVIRRLEPVILELEASRRPVLVVAHQAVLRAIYGYYKEVSLEDVPHLTIPLHTVLELRPKAYGPGERRFELGPRVVEAPTLRRVDPVVDPTR